MPLRAVARPSAAFDDLLKQTGLKRTALLPLLEPYAAIEATLFDERVA
jgi:hypothetical protein